MELAKQVLKGDRKAVARLITLVENGSAEAEKVLNLIHRYTGHAHVVGVTGPTGVGKSCLINKIIQEYRKKGKTVAVIAVDPNSPFTGGAIFGDRIRMTEHCGDKGVFIRSMGARGHPGGLSRATRDAVKILDAYGSDVIIVETVGAGQSEVDIMKLAHTTLVTLMPGMGDEIQTIKAGILEIGDIFVVNKADYEGADKTVKELEDMLKYSSKKKRWKAPIIKTTATTGQGVPELVRKINEHMQYLRKFKLLEEQLEKRSEAEIAEILTQKLADYVQEVMKRGEFKKLIQKTASREIDPHYAADRMLKQILEKT
jgi:LAO/AO transport system kinase